MIKANFSNLSLFELNLIVSCQAPIGSHMKNDEVLISVAKEVIEASAPALRVAGANCISEIRNVTKIPIIGLIKTVRKEFEPKITCTLKEVEDVYLSGAGIVAIDSTLRERPEPLKNLFTRAKSLNLEIFADIATEAEAYNAIDLGSDYIGTTLSGYTSQSSTTIGPDFDLLVKLIENTSSPIILEGRVSNPDQLRRGLGLGAFAVVVGRFITSPRDITQAYLSVL